MDPIELIGAGGGGSAVTVLILYLLRQLERKPTGADNAAVECAKQIENLSRVIMTQQEIQSKTLETMRDLMGEVKSTVHSIQITLSQRIAIEEDRRRRGEK